jgi:hypothetical protein
MLPTLVIVAPIEVAVPAVVPMKVLVYLPLPALVTLAPKFPLLTPVPLEFVKVISAVVILEIKLLLASLAVSVTVMLEPAVTDEALAVIVELLREIVPAVTVTLALLVTVPYPVTAAASEVAVPAVTPVKLLV